MTFGRHFKTHKKDFRLEARPSRRVSALLPTHLPLVHLPSDLRRVEFVLQHHYGNSTVSDSRPASRSPGEGREWGFMLDSHQGCQAADGQKHNPHRGHITGPLVQRLHFGRIQRLGFTLVPLFFSHSNSPRICGDYHASTRKPIELDQYSGGLHRARLHPSQYLSRGVI